MGSIELQVRKCPRGVRADQVGSFWQELLLLWVGAAVGTRVGDSVVGKPVGESVVGKRVGTAVGKAVGTAVVGKPVGGKVGGRVGARVGASVPKVGEPVGEKVLARVGLAVGEAVLVVVQVPHETGQASEATRVSSPSPCREHELPRSGATWAHMTKLPFRPVNHQSGSLRQFPLLFAFGDAVGTNVGDLVGGDVPVDPVGERVGDPVGEAIGDEVVGRWYNASH